MIAERKRNPPRKRRTTDEENTRKRRTTRASAPASLPRQFIDHDLTFDRRAACKSRTIPTRWWTSARRASTSIASTDAAPSDQPTLRGRRGADAARPPTDRQPATIRNPRRAPQFHLRRQPSGRSSAIPATTRTYRVPAARHVLPLQTGIALLHGADADFTPSSASYAGTTSGSCSTTFCPRSSAADAESILPTWARGTTILQDRPDLRFYHPPTRAVPWPVSSRSQRIGSDTRWYVPSTRTQHHPPRPAGDLSRSIPTSLI